MNWFALAVLVALALVLGWTGALLSHRGPRFAAAVLLGWAVPGLGHVILGRPYKGAVFFALLSATYLTGLTLISWHTISFDDNPFYYIGQLGSGLTWGMTAVLGGEKPYPHAGWPIAWFDPGMLYVAAPGLLNLVILLNLFQPRPSAEPAAEAKPEPPRAPKYSRPVRVFATVMFWLAALQLAGGVVALLTSRQVLSFVSVPVILTGFAFWSTISFVCYWVKNAERTAEARKP